MVEKIKWLPWGSVILAISWLWGSRKVYLRAITSRERSARLPSSLLQQQTAKLISLLVEKRSFTIVEEYLSSPLSAPAHVIQLAADELYQSNGRCWTDVHSTNTASSCVSCSEVKPFMKLRGRTKAFVINKYSGLCLADRDNDLLLLCFLFFSPGTKLYDVRAKNVFRNVGGLKHYLWVRSSTYKLWSFFCDVVLYDVALP